MWKKRFKAYLIDIILLITILVIIYLLLPQNDNLIILKEELSILNQKLISNKISLVTYFNQYSMIFHDIDKYNVIYSLINTVFILIYFIGIPLFYNGQTIGQKKMKIKIVSNNQENLNFNQLLIRNIIVNGIGYLFISTSLVYLLNNQIYMYLMMLVALIQIVILVISCYQVIKNNDGLQDKFSNTKIIEVE